MAKQGRWLWIAPLVLWAVFLCWQAGYQNGYVAGHADGWDTAERQLFPIVQSQTEAAIESPLLLTDGERR